jgi:hypothetical protein
MNLQLCSGRREEAQNSKNERHEANERKVRHRGTNQRAMGLPHTPTPRTEWHGRISRQRRGVRQPHAALAFVHWQAEFFQLATFSRFNVSTIHVLTHKP